MSLLPVVVSTGEIVTEPVTTPHLAYPFTMTAAGAAVTEQASVEEIAGCVQAIVDTPQGFRDDDPSFGIPDPLFGAMPLNTQPIVTAIGRLEPRAQITITETDDFQGGGASLDVAIAVAQ